MHMVVASGPRWLRHALFASLTIVFLLDWVNLLLKLTRYWRDIPIASHYWSVWFAICYPVPWLFLLPRWRERGLDNMLIVLFAYIGFAAAVQMRFP